MPKTSAFIFLILAFAFSSCKTSNNTKNKTWQLIWNDEFAKDGLPDSTKWNYDVGNGCPDICGWGNNELQYYTKADTANAFVKNGLLNITAKKQTVDKNNYTSAKLITKQKGDFLYGKIEVKAKLPQGIGTWPAIWMLPTNWEYGGWPSSGEIDIMEHVGHNADTVFSSVHTKSYYHSIGTQKTKGLKIDEIYKGFHLYGIEWDSSKIVFLIDDKPFFEFKNENKTFAEWPFDKKFYLILNIAVGGFWGGQKGVDDTVFPATMQVDYVRVYKK